MADAQNQTEPTSGYLPVATDSKGRPHFGAFCRREKGHAEVEHSTRLDICSCACHGASSLWWEEATRDGD